MGELLIFFLRYTRVVACGMALAGGRRGQEEEDGGTVGIGLGTVGATAVLEAWNLATASTAAIRRLFS